MGVKRFEVHLCVLDPTIGSEIKKTRPCVVISPDPMNRHMNTFVVAPLTTTSKPYPSRIPVEFAGRTSYIVLDQIRTLDLSRSIRRLGSILEPESRALLEALNEMFAP